ncbi:hypothetical protein SAMN02949497_3558 [Methylomagnum ishizawai]|uniref:Uncharacterized protein n=1 Tax=Methylomagnum ishizawai TaxID=1760988 RepID=A0A1Y6D5P1_9GAMM|nr:hypothetical protein SAMN02949497_3558 [Methylomagnum ishizawai]
MKPIMICRECRQPLTEEEVEYYEDRCRCERCEGEWTEQIAAWRTGGEDAELDALYDLPAPTAH